MQAMAPESRVALQAGQITELGEGVLAVWRDFELAAEATDEAGADGRVEEALGAKTFGLSGRGAGELFAGAAFETAAATGCRAGAEPTSMARLHLGH
jgi:hypothetical protein